MGGPASFLELACAALIVLALSLMINVYLSQDETDLQLYYELHTEHGR